MLIIRPIRHDDFEALKHVAKKTGHGFTSLPEDDELLQSRIARSVASINKDVATVNDESYLFVLEDTLTQKVVGTCGIEAAVGTADAFYHYRLGKEVYYSKDLNVRNEVQTLTLCHDYTGATELCTLYLDEDYRQGDNGRLLSRSRLLFLASHPHRFASTVIAEMRGVSDRNGASPFYDWLQKYFFTIDFPEADYLSGVGKKTFMAELMPRSPIYTCLLPQDAQAVIGQVHPSTAPALKLLQKEGFSFRNYVDIFDAGPTIECQLSQIESVKNSQVFTVNADNVTSTTRYLVTNLGLTEFRATICEATIAGAVIHLEPKVIDGLMINNGGQVRVIEI
ncbi:arginine N-succinyltransferase [Paraferrimonas sp. SM1919]|uniref:arginine N-succinyltransferase n=1 Tax=Paraferrimonas sp. SM1919 TaxID=2662263 RepID=UPI0013D166AF|nr:arginine N-succinyltransferase [Paraferrimonas sp. SM1919]